MWTFPTYLPVEKPVCPQWRVSHSLTSVVHQAIWPCVVGFHKGVRNLSRPLFSKHVLHWLDLILILAFFSLVTNWFIDESLLFITLQTEASNVTKIYTGM